MSATAERLSCAGTAKIVRKAIKTAFPGVKFSVRSDTYSGGASIDIRWTDGPNREAVEAVVKHYGGADFDGMQDLKTYHDTVLVGPDGPRLVHFGADFVFCDRTVSREAELRTEAEAIIRERCACTGEPPLDRFGDEWVSNLAAGMVQALDFTRGDTLEDAFLRVVLRRP